MYRRIFIILGLTAFVLSSFAQEKVQVKGKISDKENKDPVPYVNIINKSARTGTSSDLNGQFNIVAALGDTLIFSAVGFSKYSLVISKNLQEVYLEIQLDTEAMELRPVRVFAYRNLESLKKAIVDLNLPAEKSQGLSFNLPAAPEYTPEGGGMAFGGAITGLINATGLNKEYNEKKKLLVYQEEDKKRKLAASKYNAEIVHDWTGLEGEDLSSFMEFCKLSEDYIIDASEYDLAVTIHQCLQEYKEVKDN